MPRRKLPAERSYGDGSITARRNGAGEVVGYQVAVSVDGKRVYRRAQTEAEAEAIRRQLVARKRRGKLRPDPPRLKMDVLLTKWLASKEPPEILPRVHRLYEQRVRTYIVPALGHLRAADLRPADVDDWLRGLAKLGLAESTIRTTRIILSAALEWAADREEIARNPARRVRVPKGKPPEIRLPPEIEHGRAFLAAVADHPLTPLWHLAAYLGLRRGELLGLTWAAIDLDAGALRVEGQHQRYEGEWRRLPPKSRAGVRAIPLPAELVEMLRQRKAEQLRERVKAREWQASDLVFTTTTGRPLHTNSLYQLLTLVCRRAGIPYKSPHHHRHFFSSQLMAGSAPGKVQQRLMGHSGPISTERYQHSTPDLERAAMDELGRVIRGTIC